MQKLSQWQLTRLQNYKQNILSTDGILRINFP